MPFYFEATGAASLVVDGLRSCFTRAGDFFCWGAATVTTSYSTPISVSYGVFTQSLSHTCEVTPSELHCYGANDRGQLGLGTTTPSGAGPVATTETFVQLVAGDAFTCGLNTMGEAFCWGKGDYGQLGNGQIGDTNTPQALESVERDIWCWGNVPPYSISPAAFPARGPY